MTMNKFGVAIIVILMLSLLPVSNMVYSGDLNDGISVVNIYEYKITTEKNEEIHSNQGYTVETEKGETT